MTMVPICTGTLFPYLWSRTTKNSMSLLHWGKSGIVRLGSMYPLYGVEMPPIPLRCSTSPIKFPQWKDPQPHFCTESLTEGRNLVPSIHRCLQPPLSQPRPHWNSQVAIPRDQGCDTKVLLAVCSYLLKSLAPLYLVVCLGGKVGGIHYPPISI